jgi:hypothetical protein
MEADVRIRMKRMDAGDERVLRLIDLLPLPAGLLEIGEKLGESEAELRTKRRELYSFSNRRGEELSDELARRGGQLTLSGAGEARLKRMLGYDSEPECLLAVVDLVMVSERITRIQHMASA